MGVYKLTRPSIDPPVHGPDLHSAAEPWADSADACGAEKNDLQIHDVYLQYHDELCSGVMKKFDVCLSEAEDVVQTAFTRYAETSVVIENPRAFLYKTCFNIAIDQMRRRQVQLSYVQSVVDCEAGPVEEVGPERLLDGRQRLGILSRALWAMPGKRRQLLMMSRFDGLSYAEIARRVNLSETVVRKHISNALAGCQQALQAQQK